MYDPFKRMRSKLARQARQQANSTIRNMLDAMGISPQKPKRKASRPEKPVRQTRVATKAKTQPIPTSRARTTTPRGASFRKATYASAFGTRAYKLYIPSVAPKMTGPLPLVVMLHGCGQTPDDFARGTGMNALAEEFGFLVLYPAQERSTQIHRCWNWYKRDDQQRATGEPALLAGLTRHVIDQTGADPARVYIAGLSAGASAALIMASAYPDIFAAVGCHSGLAAGAAHDEAGAIFAMQHGAPGERHADPMPTIIFHGDADLIVNPRNARFVTLRALEPYAALRKTERKGGVTGGRKYVRTTHRIGRSGRPIVEYWAISGGPHAWSGGNPAGSFTDPMGPDASREMVRFFLRHRTTGKRRATLPDQTGRG